MSSNQVDDISQIEKLSGVDNLHVWKLQIDIVFQSAGIDEFALGTMKQENLTDEKDKKEFIKRMLVLKKR
ncbi:unnamed protein product [Arctia plantaginis]|uniref:Uncharacterized protein n=1 Tax=Arctia plantaginis TaxID=874455 RepID=A0A8S1BM21_ARCPL|nr:unnamed protein product [Arctia plantaginis]